MIQSAQRLPYSDSCVPSILRIRAEIQERRARLPQLKLDLDRHIDAPFDTDPRREDERQKSSSRLRREIDNLQDEIGRLEDLLQRMEENCRESEARAPGAEGRAGLENSLRQTIDDPRCWRDGDPALSRLVSDGFKRLYPVDSEE